MNRPVLPALLVTTTLLLSAAAEGNPSPPAAPSSPSGGGPAPPVDPSQPVDPWPPGAGSRAGHALLFVMERGAVPLDRGSAQGRPGDRLGRLTDSDVARLVPGAGRSATCLIGGDELSLWCGDIDRDGVHGDRPGGSLDALGIRRDRDPHAGDLLPQLVFSTEHDLGLPVSDWGDDLDGAFDGSLFRLERDPSGRAEVRVFLAERDLLRALGQPPPPWGDVDVDAFTQSAQGDLFLSFRHDEEVHGVVLADDGVACVPADALVFDAKGDVQWVQPASARIVLDKARVDALVQHAEIRRPSGTLVGSAVDLAALALDPAGGRFTPVEPVPGLEQGVPHLLFAGQALGPTVLTTAGEGRLATLDGQPLGSQRMSGPPLGLAPAGAHETRHDLGALHVVPSGPARPRVRVATPRFDVVTGGESLDIALDGFPGDALVWIGLGSTTLGWGERLSAVPWSGPGAAFALPPGSRVWPVVSDVRGRARLTLTASHKPAAPFLLVAQALSPDGPRLSAPTGVWVH